MVFTWDDSYEVGLPESDAAHKNLVEVTNRVFALLEAGSVKGVFAVLGELQQYAALHFVQEVKLMDEFQYPEQDRARHIAAHEMFVRKVQFFLSHGVDDNILVLKLAVFLRDWWHDHLLGEDRLLYSFLGTIPA